MIGVAGNPHYEKLTHGKTGVISGRVSSITDQSTDAARNHSIRANNKSATLTCKILVAS